MTAYNRLPDIVYNEFDQQAAAWLRELIKRNLIAPGDVDTRSIVGIDPAELIGVTQFHAFAGIGVWSYALRQAGWPDDRNVWTGSPPCQPFSAAGKGLGTADDRHLWPVFHRLLDVCRPDTFFGEQVASKDALAWLDHVRADVENSDYAFGVFDLCAAGFGAPHIRQRLKFVGTRQGGGSPRRSVFGRPGQHDGVTLGDAIGSGLEGHRRHGDDGDQSRWIGTDASRPTAATGQSRSVAFAHDTVRGPDLSRGDIDHGTDAGRPQGSGDAGTGGAGDGLADDHGRDTGPEWEQRSGQQRLFPEDGRDGFGLADASDSAGQRGEPRTTLRGLLSEVRGDVPCGPAGPTNGLWGDADWLLCRDGKWRPVEPGAQQMVDGSAESLGRVCDSRLAAVESAVEAWSIRHQRSGIDSVRNLWDILSAWEIAERQDGGFDSVQEAPFLLAFLRQLTNQGWRFSIGDERAGTEASRRSLRVLRFDRKPAYSSRGRGLDEQQSDESSDPLRELSSILAYHTEICWGETGWKDASPFPLIVGAEARVSRLRGFGNAIVAPAAAHFIAAFLDAEADGFADLGTGGLEDEELDLLA